MRPAPPPDVLVRVEAPGLTTGFVMCGGKCVAAPKRLAHLIGNTTAEIRAWITQQPNWKATIVKFHPTRRHRR